jgi:hypothetical protein
MKLHCPKPDSYPVVAEDRMRNRKYNETIFFVDEVINICVMNVFTRYMASHTVVARTFIKGN